MENHPQAIEAFANLDLLRARRTGVPEVVLAERKTAAQTAAIVRRMLDTNGRAMVSRVPADMLPVLESLLDGEIVWARFGEGRTLVLHMPGSEVAPNGGAVGILTAGTSDMPAAEEAAALCREMGCTVTLVNDVGVAGLHRLFAPLQHMVDSQIDAIIVAAGMDGALPSVVAGLVDVPVIGLPTSVGYGFGGGGVGALTSMLQTCAPGLAVVNIDNGIGAGAMAGRIAARAGAARRAAA